MKKRKFVSAILMAAAAVSITACNNSAEVTASTAVSAVIVEDTTVAATAESTENTEAATPVESTESVTSPETAAVNWEMIAPDEVESSDYKISSGTWFYQGVEDEKSIDMDGLKGFTTFTAEAIPEVDGYLQYLGVNPDGCHEFEVYDLYGRYYTSMIFVSEEQFYLGGDENEYYVKWDY